MRDHLRIRELENDRLKWRGKITKLEGDISNFKRNNQKPNKAWFAKHRSAVRTANNTEKKIGKLYRSLCAAGKLELLPER